MTSDFQLPTDSGKRRFRRALAWGLSASVLLHAAALLVTGAVPVPMRSPGEEDAATAEPERFGGLEAVDLRASAPSPVAERRVRVPEQERPRVRSPRIRRSTPETRPVVVELPRVALAPGGEAGPAGRRTGGATGQAGVSRGQGRRATSEPVPRTLQPRWSTPEGFRGLRVTVRVEVGADGRPTGRVELVPPTPSESFNRELRRAMTSVDYVPARRNGEPVRAWAEITFTF